MILFQKLKCILWLTFDLAMQPFCFSACLRFLLLLFHSSSFSAHMLPSSADASVCTSLARCVLFACSVVGGTFRAARGNEAFCLMKERFVEFLFHYFFLLFQLLFYRHPPACRRRRFVRRFVRHLCQVCGMEMFCFIVFFFLFL